MTQEEKDIEVEKLRLGLVESYKAKAWWSYTVRAWVTKIPSYRRKEPIQDEVILVKSNMPFYFTIFLFLVVMLCGSIKHNKVDYTIWGYMSIFLLIILWIVFYYQNKNVKRIIINRDGITCDEAMTQWKDIFQIYTASYKYARGSNRVFLCIALNDYSFREFEVSNWAYRNIGNTLEHYRVTYIDKE